MKKKLLVALSAFALPVGLLSVNALPAEAAGGPVKYAQACEALGYKTVAQVISLRKDGFGNKIGELRTMRKTGASKNKWCTYLKKTDNTVGNNNVVRLRVEVLTKSSGKFTTKSASLTETVKYYSSSFTYTSLEGTAGTSHRTILYASTGMKSASSSTWYTTATTMVG
ncbi:hypothetical protein F1D05_22145 [Kribbella qitaiheensis]|uniref:Uncharacterized protein n=1 Tax=Kribbella qitaiheensis TaxID=1544730 RepID=A0A7G6X1K5_9ACTN|nr:hypothetical protein [Kribbella qitaiheensis]QNE20120.1 hypothetical protein F1D05_22145 [Kribbella qitaiheensis]